MTAARTIADLVPWETRRIDNVIDMPGMWGFNPSILRTLDGRWLATVRFANYHMPGSVAQDDAPAIIRNRNVMLELDPATLEPVRAVEIAEGGALARRARTPNLSVNGYEDLRLIETGRDGVVAIANTLELSRNGRLEIALLDLDADYQITGATPLRGAWSTSHQKNWSPYQHTEALRLLYSVEEGGIHDEAARIVATHPVAGGVGDRRLPATAGEAPRRAPFREHSHGSTSVKTFSYGRRQAGGELPTVGPGTRSGRNEFPLRGGTQLVQVHGGMPWTDPSMRARDDRWIGLAHGCRVTHEKYYWHVWCCYDGLGNLLRTSEPIKLSTAGIEFAAGLAVDPDDGRLVVSFGVEDDSAWLGVTSLGAVLELFPGGIP